MLKEIKQQIERLKSQGATYVDARWYPFEEANYLMMWNGNLKNAAASRESGVGVRVLYKGAWGFSASSDLSEPGGAVRQGPRQRPRRRRAGHLPGAPGGEGRHPGRLHQPHARSTRSRCPWRTRSPSCKQMDEKLNQPGVFQRVSELIFMRKQIIFVDSEGSEIEKNITEVFPSICR